MSVLPPGALGGAPGMPPGGGAPALPPSLGGGQRPALPPSLQGSDRTPGITTPGPHMGAAANGIVKVRNAVEMLQQALPTIPMGTELWTAVHKACVDIGKHLRPEDRDQGAQVGGLLQQIRQTAQAGPQNAVARLTPQGPQPPVMPPPAGAGAP